MVRVVRINQLLAEARERVAECERAVKRCEEECNRTALGASDAIRDLMDTYRQGADEAREEVTMWEELLSKNYVTL